MSERPRIMSNSTIRLGGSVDFVELEVVAYGTLEGRNEGDLRLAVSVRSGDFAGKYGEVWIAKDEWQSFLISLAQLERERKGTASLLAMSPDEFELHLQITDRAGHLVAFGFLARHFWLPPTHEATISRVHYGMRLDPSMLRVFVEQFTSLGVAGV